MRECLLPGLPLGSAQTLPWDRSGSGPSCPYLCTHYKELIDLGLLSEGRDRQVRATAWGLQKEEKFQKE